MTNFEILKNAFFDSIIYLIIFSILSYAVFLILKKRQDNTDDVNIEIENKVNEEQFFGFEEFKNAEQFQKEANEIMKLVDDGKQVRVPFAKAMYILKNFKNYNVFTSEDQKIIFDKLKKIIDEEVELDHSKTIDKNIETERIQASTKPFDITNEKLEDGSIKVYNPNGYTIMKDSLIISSVNYADKIKKLEHEKMEDGVAQLAFGFGGIVVQGGNSLRISPRYPKKVMQLSSIDDAIKTHPLGEKCARCARRLYFSQKARGYYGWRSIPCFGRAYCPCCLRKRKFPR